MADMIISTGFPNMAIQEVHASALNRLSRDYEVVADEPVRTTTFHGSSLTRYEVSRTGRGVRLFGYFSDTGNRRMERLALRHFGISYGGTGMFANGDYEHELQQAVRLRGGEVTALFPRNHHQPLISASSGVKKYE